MINFFGNVCLIIALCASLIQTLGVVPHAIARLGRPACQTAALFTFGAFFTICFGFLTYNPSMQVVLQNSLISDPWYVRLSGVWNNHVTLMLLWSTLFSGFGSLYVLRSKNRNIDHLSRPVIGVQGFIQSGFLLYMVVFLSPFQVLDKPLVVDFSNVEFSVNVHQLFIYAGYMLISIVYALVIGILIEGKRVALLKYEAMPWIIPSWTLIFIGSTLGIMQEYFALGEFYVDLTKLHYEAVLTLALMTLLFAMIPYIEANRVIKKVVLLWGIVVFFQALFGSLLNQSVSLLHPDLKITDLPETKFLFIFLGLGVGFSLMIYMGRVLRSLRKNKEIDLNV